MKPECPVDAIFSEDELPPDQIPFIEINERLSKEWPNISEKEALPEAKKFAQQKEKLNLLKESLDQVWQTAGIDPNISPEKNTLVLTSLSLIRFLF